MPLTDRPMPRRVSLRPLTAALALIALGAAALSGPDARAANVSHPATYNGAAATGGSVEFDVAADGTAVTRFAVSGVATTCGTISATALGSFSIAGDAFSNGSATATGLRFEGTFPAVQQAQGSISLRLAGFPSCTSDKVAWSATTPTPPPDSAAPQTKISSGPSGGTESRKATFRFRSSEAGSSFQCKLDGRKWGTCGSPKTYKNLKEGKHTFKVRARDVAGNVDPTPAKRSWRVDSSG